MADILRPVLELSVIIPGILLAYLPVKSYLKQTPFKLTAWLLPLLLGICIFGGAVCCAFHFPTRWVLFPLLPVIMLIYHKTLKISVWKSVSIFLAVFAVFACINSLSRAVNALITADLHITENELWFHTGAGIFYNVICLLFVLAAWYPACHRVQTMIADENFAQTWYVFWILPVIFIGVNLFMIPKYRSTLYTGRVLQCYIVLSLVLLIILLLFYAMFLMLAVSLNRNARLQHETIFFPFSRKGTRISAWPLKKQDRPVTISAIILSSCPLWQNRVTWKRSKNISWLQPAKSLTITCISVKIRLLTVFSDIIPPLPKEKTSLFMHWFPCLLIFP